MSHLSKSEIRINNVEFMIDRLWSWCGDKEFIKSETKIADTPEASEARHTMFEKTCNNILQLIANIGVKAIPWF